MVLLVGARPAVRKILMLSEEKGGLFCATCRITSLRSKQRWQARPASACHSNQWSVWVDLSKLSKHLCRPSHPFLCLEEQSFPRVSILRAPYPAASRGDWSACTRQGNER